jgi:hypothetical protein
MKTFNRIAGLVVGVAIVTALVLPRNTRGSTFKGQPVPAAIRELGSYTSAAIQQMLGTQIVTTPRRNTKGDRELPPKFPLPERPPL